MTSYDIIVPFSASSFCPVRGAEMSGDSHSEKKKHEKGSGSHMVSSLLKDARNTETYIALSITEHVYGMPLSQTWCAGFKQGT